MTAQLTGLPLSTVAAYCDQVLAYYAVPPSERKSMPAPTPPRNKKKQPVKVELEWRDPPERRYQTPARDWTALLAPLREHPGRWARLANCPRSSGVQGLRATARKAYPGAEWELTSKREEDGTYSLYARFHAQVQTNGAG